MAVEPETYSDNLKAMRTKMIATISRSIGKTRKEEGEVERGREKVHASWQTQVKN